MKAGRTRVNNEAFQKIVDAITAAYNESAAEIIQYEIRSSKMWLAILIVLTVVTVAIMIANHLCNKKRDLSCDDETRSVLVITTGTILIVVFIFSILYQIDDIYTAMYFPEKTIMRYIKYTVNNLYF
jgi:phosphotransferase system  glucose/maltose/N-acetylglucosamine-specific IIC component